MTTEAMTTEAMMTDLILSKTSELKGLVASVVDVAKHTKVDIM